MAIKVVSDKPTKTKRVTCPTCTYELEFTGEDVRTSTDCDGDSWQTIRCPRKECKQGTISVRWP